jgi:hypothetical protein
LWIPDNSGSRGLWGSDMAPTGGGIDLGTAAANCGQWWMPSPWHPSYAVVRGTGSEDRAT